MAGMEFLERQLERISNERLKREMERSSLDETLDRALEMLSNQEARIQMQMDRLAQLPEDDFGNGAVITFQKQFREGGRIYDYAAIKAAGLWYSTGPLAPKGFTWDALMAWLIRDIPVEAIYWCPEAKRIY
jgi:hypothetical protein